MRFRDELYPDLSLRDSHEQQRLYSLGVSQCTPVHSCAMRLSTHFRLWLA
jgi:hypothetical protein